MSQPHGSDPSPGPSVPPSAAGSAGAPSEGRPALAGRASSTGTRFALVALVAAVLALLLASGSALFAWRAVDQAKDAKSIALSGRPAGTPSQAPPSAATSAAESPVDSSPSSVQDVPRSPGEEPELTEQTVYEPKYDKQTLILKARCGYSMYADLDEPRAKNEQDDADLRFIAGCGNQPTNFRLLDGVQGSEAARPGMTPKDCAEKIRSAPVGKDAAIPVRKDAAICVTTNYQEARARGDEWRMILLYVVGVANDGATTVEVYAWDIPD
ncbi:hypothetical protein [Micromonospora sp. NPDC049497]|uniref:hypothetical protein n=1 Tax=Micromonospora sp. NPDC049497 TaxID=3364273 RepID=UPI003799B8F4